jgi:hypothetical protein
MKPLLMDALLMTTLLHPEFAGAESANITRAELIRRTQQLFDAVPSGD